MPYARRRFRSRRKSSYRRPSYRYSNARGRYNKRRKYYASTSMVKQPSSTPDRMMTKLKWSRLIALTADVSSPFVQQYVISGNSLFEPDITGVATAHQPYSFDEWSAFYDNYAVYASKIAVTFTANVEDEATPTLVAIIPQADQVLSGGYTTLLGMPLCRSKLIGNQRTNAFIKHYLTTKKGTGANKYKVGTENVAAVNANPTLRWYWHVISMGTHDIPAVYCKIDVKYYVIFSERRELSGS